jgi:pteridine reductase
MRPLALVTGASQRLGAQCSLFLASQHWDLALCSHEHLQEAQVLSEQIEKLGGFCEVFRTDLCISGSLETLLEQVLSKFHQYPTLIIHCASERKFDTPKTAQLPDLEHSLRLHAWVPWELAKLLSSKIKEETASQIILFLDARTSEVLDQEFSYSWGKRIAQFLVSDLALSFAPGVRINAIAPGLVLRDEAVEEGVWQAWVKKTPLGVAQSSADVIKALEYLIQNQGITGQVLYIDAGRHLKRKN